MNGTYAAAEALPAAFRKIFEKFRCAFAQAKHGKHNPRGRRPASTKVAGRTDQHRTLVTDVFLWLASSAASA
jgi:hypothetical protein